jgi:hypothetical protein
MTSMNAQPAEVRTLASATWRLRRDPGNVRPRVALRVGGGHWERRASSLLSSLADDRRRGVGSEVAGFANGGQF